MKKLTGAQIRQMFLDYLRKLAEQKQARGPASSALRDFCCASLAVSE